MGPFSIELLESTSNSVGQVANMQQAIQCTIDSSWAFVAIPDAFDIADTDITLFVAEVEEPPSAEVPQSIAKNTHGLETGMSVVFTSTGTLPAPLTGAAVFIIKKTANTFTLATTRANALAGVELILEDTGTAEATITVTPEANAGSLLIESSGRFDKDIWRTVDNIALGSESSPVLEKITDVTFHYLRATLSITSGVLSSCLSFVHGKSV